MFPQERSRPSVSFTVRVPLFKQLHRPGDRRPATDRVHPKAVTQFVRLDHPRQVAVHDHRPEGAAGLVLRTRTLLRLKRTVRDPDDPLAGDRTGVQAWARVR